MTKARTASGRGYLIVRRYRTSISVVDERLLSLDIDTRDPLPQKFFDDLETLIKIHLE